LFQRKSCCIMLRSKPSMRTLFGVFVWTCFLCKN